MADTLPNPFGFAHGLIQHFHVAGKTNAGSGNIPDVKIMNAAYPGDLFQDALDFLEVQPFRGGIHKNPGGRLKNRPAVLQDEKDDEHGKQGVKPVPGPEEENCPIDQHHDRSQKITHHVKEGPAHIQAML